MVSHRKTSFKNREEESTEQGTVWFATVFPTYGQVRACNGLRKQGIFVCPSGVCSIRLRHDFASMTQWMAALKNFSAAQGPLLIEA